MLGTFGALSSKVKVQYGKIRLDNSVFRLHYKVTAMFLIGACILVTSSQYIGNPIQCILNGKKAPDAINTYCWISSTFSVVGAWQGKEGVDVAFPGVGPIEYERNPFTGEYKAKDIKQHAYYQWVPFVLFLQGLMFYFPHWLWKTFDGGRVRGVVSSGCAYSLKEEDRKEKRRLLSKYMVNHIRTHNVWYLQFVFCEFLNLVNVIGNIFFTDTFLGNEFTQYGIQVADFMEEDPENRTDPMTRVFPRVTKCTWHQYGYSGTIQVHDALCVLAWNIINEKIYVFLWFWFVILAIITGIAFIYRIASMLYQPLRARALLLRNSAARDEVDCVLNKCKVGDWYFLYHVSSNMDPWDFRDFLQMLAEELKVGGGMDGVEMKRLYPTALEKMAPEKA